MIELFQCQKLFRNEIVEKQLDFILNHPLEQVVQYVMWQSTIEHVIVKERGRWPHMQLNNGHAVDHSSQHTAAYVYYDILAQSLI